MFNSSQIDIVLNRFLLPRNAALPGSAASVDGLSDDELATLKAEFTDVIKKWIEENATDAFDPAKQPLYPTLRLRYFLNSFPFEKPPETTLQDASKAISEGLQGFVCFKVTKTENGRTIAVHVMDVIDVNASNLWYEASPFHGPAYDLPGENGREYILQASATLEVGRIYRALCAFKTSEGRKIYAESLFDVVCIDQETRKSLFGRIPRKFDGAVILEVLYTSPHGYLLEHAGIPNDRRPIGPPRSLRRRREVFEFDDDITDFPGDEPGKKTDKKMSVDKQYFYVMRHSNFSMACRDAVLPLFDFAKAVVPERIVTNESVIEDPEKWWYVVTFGRACGIKKRIQDEFNPVLGANPDQWSSTVAYDFKRKGDHRVIRPAVSAGDEWNAYSLEKEVKRVLREATRRTTLACDRAKLLMDLGVMPFDHPFPAPGWKTESCLIRVDKMNQFLAVSSDNSASRQALYKAFFELFIEPPPSA
jgi:hypothetical protein